MNLNPLLRNANEGCWRVCRAHVDFGNKLVMTQDKPSCLEMSSRTRNASEGDDIIQLIFGKEFTCLRT